MNLSTALSNAITLTELLEIFDNDIEVKIAYINDQVTVKNYACNITTYQIAHKIMTITRTLKGDKLAPLLGKCLAEKVFHPLKVLVESTSNYCSLYQISALTRVAWIPPPANEFGDAVALKHAMVLSFLDSTYDCWN
jgi:hypothetical protein